MAKCDAAGPGTDDRTPSGRVSSATTHTPAPRRSPATAGAPHLHLHSRAGSTPRGGSDSTTTVMGPVRSSSRLNLPGRIPMKGGGSEHAATGPVTGPRPRPHELRRRSWASWTWSLGASARSPKALQSSQWRLCSLPQRCCRARAQAPHAQDPWPAAIPRLQAAGCPLLPAHLSSPGPGVQVRCPQGRTGRGPGASPPSAPDWPAP